MSGCGKSANCRYHQTKQGCRILPENSPWTCRELPGTAESKETSMGATETRRMRKYIVIWQLNPAIPIEGPLLCWLVPTKRAKSDRRFGGMDQGLTEV